MGGGEGVKTIVKLVKPSRVTLRFECVAAWLAAGSSGGEGPRNISMLLTFYGSKVRACACLHSLFDVTNVCLASALHVQSVPVHPL
jgi:hypothetical protein